MSSYEPNSAIVVLYDSKEYKALDKKSGGAVSSVCGLKSLATKDTGEVTISFPSKINVDYLQIYCCNESLDGRSALATKGKTAGRIFNYSAIEYTNTSGFLRFLNDWFSHRNLTITYEAENWIQNNSPSTIVKMKSGATKKEVIVYDLPLIFNELSKLTVLDKKELDLDDVKIFQFSDHNKNIFDFFNVCMYGKPSDILKGLIDLNESHGHQMILMVFLSQLFFYLKIAEYKESKINKGKGEH